MPSPQFIVFEGPDGSGTTFHAKCFAERCRDLGHKVLLTCEPSSGPVGGEIRSILQKRPLPSPDSLQLLFCADRADHLQREILPALEEGKIVICDRYTLSTIIYGAAQNVSVKWLEDINQHFRKPDLTILTLPPYSVCRERLQRREISDHFEDDVLAKRIYAAYEGRCDPQTIRIDTSGDKEEVAERIFARVGIEKVNKLA